MQLINYHLFRFFGAQNLSHLRLLSYMRFDFEEELDDLFGPELFSKVTMVVEFYQLFLMQELFCLHQVCLQDSYIRNHSPPHLPSCNQLNGRLLTSQLLHQCMFTRKVYHKSMTYLVRCLKKIYISLVLNRGK